MLLDLARRAGIALRTLRPATTAPIVGGSILPALLLLVGCFAPFFLSRAIGTDLPVGFGGLYALMAEGILAENFALPATIPHYGPGGMPFAYPPFAFYVMALATGPFGIDPLLYLRFAPPLFLLASLVAMFLFVHRLTASKLEAWWATALFALAPAVADMHANGAGVCRALALLLMFAALRALAGTLARPTVAGIVLCAGLSGLTALTHAKYATFLVVTSAILALRHSGGMRRLAVIGAGAAVTLLPWILAVLHIHGAGVFTRALATHDTLGFVDYMTDPRALAELLASVFLSQASPLAVGSGAVGIALHLATGAWLPLLWFVATVAAMGVTGARFVAIVGAILGASVIRQLTESFGAASAPAVSRRWMFLVALFVPAYLYAFASFRAATPTYPRDFVDAAKWVGIHAPLEARVFVATEAWHETEMFTYFARRTPVASPFGAEWTGRFQSEFTQMVNTAACVQRQSYSCLADYFRTHDMAVDLLVVAADPLPDSIRTVLARTAPWKHLQTVGRYSIWTRADAR